jgi:DNA-directed RNA polymerase subunit RPC12/RpoP
LRKRASTWARSLLDDTWSTGVSHCDTQGVTAWAHSPDMNIQLICPWCEDEVRFEVDEAEDELACSACGTRMAFAPDPVATFSLIYEAA